KLVLTYPLYDAEGRPALPSFFVEEVRKIFPALSPVAKKLEDLVPPPAEWVIEEEATRGLALGLFQKGPSSYYYPELFKEWAAKPFFREIAEWGYTADRAAIGSAAARKIFSAEKTVYSPTRLETVATCAFKHFAGRVLKLKEPFEGREFVDKGNVLHQVLEEFYKELPRSERAGPAFWKNPARARELLFKKLDDVMAKEESFRHEPLYRRKAYRESMRRTLNLYVERETDLVAERDFTPSYFEWVFGLEGKRALEVPDEKGPIAIGGRVDRIDVDKSGQRALVMDYKLSKRSMSIPERLEKGIELQLPLYFLAVERLLGLHVAGGELRLLQKADEETLYPKSEAEWKAMLSEAEERVRRTVGRMRGADISVRSKSCEHCAFSPVCRFEPWRLVYEENAK
ncbi:MAG: PD-(D/E)XK nuclease family protein, partial [Methylocella sp.]